MFVKELVMMNLNPQIISSLLNNNTGYIAIK